MIAVLTGLACLLGLALLRIPLGLCLLFVGVSGIAFVHPKGLPAGLEIAGQQILEISLNYQFSVLPLFILMGVFVSKARFSEDLFEAAEKWLGHWPGGLAMATVASTAGFASISASSIATTATMAKIAFPPMRRRGYADSFSAGTIAAGGTLGILIPPSAGLIIYGLIAEVSIPKLFWAGILPGLLTVALYFCTIILIANLRPDAGPRNPRSSLSERMSALRGTWGILVLFALVMGGITTGIFTATEAGGVGAAGALCFAIARGRMSIKALIESFAEAAQITATIFFVAIGALTVNQFVNLSGMPGDLVDFVDGTGLSPNWTIMLILAVFVLLGMVLEGLAMIFLAVPIFVPLVSGLGFDLVWWGVLLVMTVEISLITPPIGLNLYVMKSMTPDLPLSAIMRGVFPFFVADLVRLTVVVWVPAIALFLPNLLFS